MQPGLRAAAWETVFPNVVSNSKDIRNPPELDTKIVRSVRKINTKNRCKKHSQSIFNDVAKVINTATLSPPASAAPAQPGFTLLRIFQDPGGT